MLNVLVCDDNPIFLEEMRSILSQLPQVKASSYFTSPRALVEAAAQEAPDLVLMDLQFENDRNGLEWAEELNLAAPDARVICVTGYNDHYAPQVLLHQFNLLGYLTKPVDQTLLERYLNKALAQQDCGYLSFSFRGKNYSVSVYSIAYLESRNHTVILYTKEETFEFYEKLSNLHTRLPDFFVMCHKSYLVNLKQVVRLEPRYLLLASGASIPVSRARQAGVQEAFFHHIGQNV